MKKIFYPVTAFAVIAALVIPILADTIRLKDGSVIRGEVVGFKDQQFVVLIGAGAKGRRSQTTIYVEDVESIEFDSTGGSSSAQTTTDTGSGDNTRSESPVSQPSRTEPSSTTSRRTTQPVGGSSPTFFTIKVSVRADNPNNGWTNSGLVVRKGQRLRISSSGRVSLGNGRYTTPAGVSTIPDNEKLMRTEPTGALIAVIGDDNDDFILVGTRRDFVAQRDGVLFLGVNEGNLADNTGTYDIVVEAEAGGGNTR
jgi:PA-IL-like protein